MNRLFSKGIWLLLIITISTLSAQEKSISLDDINEGVFRAEYLSALRSMNNGKEYSVYNYDRKSKNSTIDVYDYKTGDKVRTLLNTAEIEGLDYIPIKSPHYRKFFFVYPVCNAINNTVDFSVRGELFRFSRIKILHK